MIQSLDGGFGPEHEGLVAQVKEMQRTNPDAKDQWVAFTDLHGQGTRDPMKHPCDLMTAFIAHLNSGQRLAVHEDTHGIIDIVKVMQKKSSNFKSVWQHYCFQYGMGKNDPNKHDNAYHVRFLDFMAHTAWVSLQNSGELQKGGDGPPMKRHRGDYDGKGPPAASGGSAKDQLVSATKNFQRQGEAQKELWARYADMYLGGIRDPGRHDVATLQEFCQNHGVPMADNGSSGYPQGGGMGGGAYGGDFGMGGGMPGGGWAGGMDPSMGGMPGGMGPPPIGSGDPYKDSLVGQVKNFQRQGDQQKELWGMYADMYLGGIRDPNRHDAATLQEFCQNHNVPMASLDPVAASISRGGQMGGGMPMVGYADPVKDALVQRVKNYQKGPTEQKEAWNTFSGATRDPARHDAIKLQEFCSMYNVP